MEVVRVHVTDVTIIKVLAVDTTIQK